MSEIVGFSKWILSWLDMNFLLKEYGWKNITV